MVTMLLAADAAELLPTVLLLGLAVLDLGEPVLFIQKQGPGYRG